MTGAAKRHACHAVPYDGAGSQRLRAAVFLAVFLAAFFAVFFVVFFTVLRAAFLATLRGAAFRAVLAVFFDVRRCLPRVAAGSHRCRCRDGRDRLRL